MSAVIFILKLIAFAFGVGVTVIGVRPKSVDPVPDGMIVFGVTLCVAILGGFS